MGLLVASRKKNCVKTLKMEVLLCCVFLSLIWYVIFVTGDSGQHVCICHSEQLRLCRSVIGLGGPSFETRQMTHFPEHSRESVIICI